VGCGSINLSQSLMAEFCEHVNEHSDFIKAGNFLAVLI
jgi:hypothetical protein